MCTYTGYIRLLRIQRMCCPALVSCLGFMSGFLRRVVYTGAYVNADVIFFTTYSSHLNANVRARHICSIRNESVFSFREDHEIAMRFYDVCRPYPMKSAFFFSRFNDVFSGCGQVICAPTKSTREINEILLRNEIFFHIIFTYKCI